MSAIGDDDQSGAWDQACDEFRILRRHQPVLVAGQHQGRDLKARKGARAIELGKRLELQIGGVWMPFDPDFYCDAH